MGAASNLPSFYSFGKKCSLCLVLFAVIKLCIDLAFTYY